MKAYLAGGCFWCMEKPYHTLGGVIFAESGYCGGTAEDAHYEKVKAQLTDHRETVCVEFDENIIEYRELIDVYFQNIDPFDAGGQFIDRGHSYTLAVYCTDEYQKKIVKQKIAELEKSSGKTVAVAVEDFKSFFTAEEYHLNYAEKNKEAYDKEYELSGRKSFFSDGKEAEK